MRSFSLQQHIHQRTGNARLVPACSMHAITRTVQPIPSSQPGIACSPCSFPSMPSRMPSVPRLKLCLLDSGTNSPSSAWVAWREQHAWSLKRHTSSLMLPRPLNRVNSSCPPSAA